MSEDVLIQYGSPTLAGLKTGNLFSVSYTEKNCLLHEIRNLNHVLVPKGLCLLPLKFTKDRALVYLYRPALLKKDLGCRSARAILEKAGYENSTLGKCLGRLIDRLRCGTEFPHEIGLFLSYPPEDVEGFIANNASRCKCVGTWKVYGDAETAEKTFRKYRHCSDVYRRRWESGSRFEKLVVSQKSAENPRSNTYA